MGGKATEVLVAKEVVGGGTRGGGARGRPRSRSSNSSVTLKESATLHPRCDVNYQSSSGSCGLVSAAICRKIDKLLMPHSPGALE